MFERIDPNYLCTNCMNVCSDMELDCPVCGKYPLTDNHPHQLPVRTILAGKYLIGRVLGQGGFGITYLGWDLNMQCRVAIKEYYPQGCANRDPATRTEVVVADGEMRQAFNNGCDRFLQEAQVLVRLESIPEIVHVREFLKENGTAYMVMEYVEGETLKQLAARRGYKLPVEEALALMKPMLIALSEVHAAGLIHRDISPDNIMVTPTGRVKLLDFGAVRVLALHGSMSTIINVKHGYAPTEQYRIQGEQGPWTDVYAICATLYKLITGVTPPMSLDRLEEDTLQSFSALGIAMEPHVEAAIRKGMALRKADRYQSVGELYAALYPHTAKVMPPTPEQPNLEATVAFVPPKEELKSEELPEKPEKKHKKIWIPIVAGCVLLGIVGGILGSAGNEKPNVGEDAPQIELDQSADSETEYSSDIKNAFPSAASFELVYENENGLNRLLSAFDASSNIIGYVGTAVANGYGGEITVNAGFDIDGTIKGITVGDENFAETANLGVKVKEPVFTDQFIGLNAPLRLNEDVAAVSGATVSSTAVTDAVNAISVALAAEGYIEQKQDEMAEENAISEETTENSIGNVNVGDKFFFGNYEQDNDIANGKEPIEWQVLEKEDSRVLVISKYALDCKPYNKIREDVSWGNSTLRNWLNGDFISTAFNDKEKAMILSTRNITEDKIFLLDSNKANQYFSNDAERKCMPTKYAVEQGVSDGYNKYSWWWLRTATGILQHDYVDAVSSNGTILESGIYKDTYGAVRPAMWIALGA